MASWALWLFRPLLAARFIPSCLASAGLFGALLSTRRPSGCSVLSRQLGTFLAVQHPPDHSAPSSLLNDISGSPAPYYPFSYLQTIFSVLLADRSPGCLAPFWLPGVFLLLETLLATWCPLRCQLNELLAARSIPGSLTYSRLCGAFWLPGALLAS